MVDEGILDFDGVKLLPKKIVRGIPCFDDSEYFYSEIDRKRTLSLASLASTIGWKNAALRVPNRFLRRYITDPSRTFFLSILEIGERERILDVGGGWGNVTAQIAKGFPTTKVYTLDKTLERLFFADQIRRQERISNMRIVQGDITDPPFEKHLFDTILMIGVLEWLGDSVRSVPPDVAQKICLERISQILRPGGKLLIGIENRLGYEYFWGHADHTKLAYTSLMPRKIASAYMKLKGRGSYRTYTYTRRGYKQLLQDSGFTNVTFYAAIPDYRFPEIICDLEMVKELTHRRFAKVLPRSIVGDFTNSFYIVARSKP